MSVPKASSENPDQWTLTQQHTQLLSPQALELWAHYRYQPFPLFLRLFILPSSSFPYVLYDDEP